MRKLIAQKTPFYEKHLELKGKIVDFCGWLLPVQYEGIISEVRKTRQNAGIFDVSHMGEFLVEGRGSEDFLQKVLTNDVSRLKNSGIMYSPVCYEHGGTLDDVLVYRFEPEKYQLVVNASNIAKDFAWFSDHLKPGVTVRDLSEDYAQIALQGPESLEILFSLTKTDLDSLKYYHFIPQVKIAGIQCIVSRTGYTGEDGFELYCEVHKAVRVWDAVWESAKTKGLTLTPSGLGARNILRLEASMPLYGHELSPNLSPLNASLDKYVSFVKEREFIGRQALLKQQKDGIHRRLAGLVMLERVIPREGYKVLDMDEEIGWVSSGSYSPTLDKFLALAFLEPERIKICKELKVVIRGKEYHAKVVELPFYRRR